MFYRESKPSSEHMKDLISIHDEIKSHPFREHFQDDQSTGTFRSLSYEYFDLIYKSTEVLSGFAYYCSDDGGLDREDMEWIHDFRSMLFTIKQYYKNTSDPYYDKVRIENLTSRDIMNKTGLTDINTIMIYFDKYLGYIHRYIETGKFDRICAVKYESVQKPGSGWYYKHLVEMVRTDSGWVFET